MYVYSICPGGADTGAAGGEREWPMSSERENESGQYGEGAGSIEFQEKAGVRHTWDIDVYTDAVCVCVCMHVCMYVYVCMFGTHGT
jgi:hypothetical protein